MGFCYLSAENEVVFLATSSDNVIRSLYQRPLCRGRHPVWGDKGGQDTYIPSVHRAMSSGGLGQCTSNSGNKCSDRKGLSTWRHQSGAFQPDWELGEAVGKLLGEEVLFKLVARGWAGINCEGELLLAQGIAYAKVQRGESGQELKKKKKNTLETRGRRARAGGLEKRLHCQLGADDEGFHVLRKPVWTSFLGKVTSLPGTVMVLCLWPQGKDE